MPSTLTRAADLRASQTGPAEVVAGTAATFTATVTNAGPSDATHVVVTAAVPPAQTAASAALGVGAGSCAAAAGAAITGNVIVGTRAHQICTVKRPTVKPPRV